MPIAKTTWLRAILVVLAFVFSLLQIGFCTTHFIFQGHPRNIIEFIFYGMMLSLLWVVWISGRSPSKGMKLFAVIFGACVAIFLASPGLRNIPLDAFGDIVAYMQWGLVALILLVANFFLERRETAMS